MVKSLRAAHTPDLDNWIEKYTRNREAADTLVARLSKGLRPTQSEKTPEPRLRHEPPSEQFTQPSSSIWFDPVSELLSISAIADPTPPTPKGVLKLAKERLSELLEVLWADVQLWKRAARNAPPEEITADILRRYGLEFPPLPAAVWQQMVWQPDKRKKLFDLLDVDFSTECDWDVLQELRRKLPPRLAGRLLYEYLDAPGLDHSNVLASQKLSPSALAYLQKAISKLQDNIAWCQQNPDVIPPPIAPALRHRTKDLERTRTIEEMVKRLLENPNLTDYQLGNRNDALRKAAAEARQLVELREREAVIRYSEQRDGRVIGRKPRRSNKILPAR